MNWGLICIVPRFWFLRREHCSIWVRLEVWTLHSPPCRVLQTSEFSGIQVNTSFWLYCLYIKHFSLVCLLLSSLVVNIISFILVSVELRNYTSFLPQNYLFVLFYDSFGSNTVTLMKGPLGCRVYVSRAEGPQMAFLLLRHVSLSCKRTGFTWIFLKLTFCVKPCDRWRHTCIYLLCTYWVAVLSWTAVVTVLLCYILACEISDFIRIACHYDSVVFFTAVSDVSVVRPEH